MNTIQKRRIKNDIVDQILSEKPFTCKVYQDRPYTCVVLTIEIGGLKTKNITGFSKVMWTDRWNEERGIEMATKRAVRKFAADTVDAKYPELKSLVIETYKSLYITKIELSAVKE